MLRAAVELYFVDIAATGRDRVPRRGPVIFAANHPNSIMDSLILGSQTSRSVSFLARSGLFDNPVVGAVLDRCGVIPVYRRQDGPPEGGGNDDAFLRAYEVLERDGTIGIFPEGKNAPERHVRDIKTGTARIALGAEARNDFALGVHVIPVGLNFERRQKAFSSVLIRFGEPIDVREYAERWSDDERGAVRDLTDRIQAGIRAAAVHIADERHDQLVRDIHRIYGREIVDELMQDRVDVRSPIGRLLDGMRGRDQRRADLDDTFYVEQRIADAVGYFVEARPEMVERIRASIERYQRRVREAELRLDFADRPPKTIRRRKETVKLTLYALLLGPIALWGLVHNFAPHTLVRKAADRAPDEAIEGVTRLLVGLVAYPAFYALFGWAIWSLTADPIRVAAYLLSLPLAGLWYLRYRRTLLKYADRIVARNLFTTNRRMVRALMLEREQLLMELRQLREEFLAAEAAR